jgi:hypothetical protein
MDWARAPSTQPSDGKETTVNANLGIAIAILVLVSLTFLKVFGII